MEKIKKSYWEMSPEEREEDRILEIKEKYSCFPDITQYYPEEIRKGEYQILPFTITPGKCAEARKMSIFNYESYYEMFELIPGNYVKLVDNSRIIMSDTPMEKKTNIDFVENANGHVLIGGLGLGMVLMAIQDKPEVTKITVIEISQDIIDMVTSVLPLNDKVEIICGDVLEWIPPKGVMFDRVYHDIWSAICSDNWEDMVVLSRRYQYKINRSNPKCGQSAWRKEDVRRLAREGSRY